MTFIFHVPWPKVLIGAAILLTALMILATVLRFKATRFRPYGGIVLAIAFLAVFADTASITLLGVHKFGDPLEVNIEQTPFGPHYKAHRPDDSGHAEAGYPSADKYCLQKYQVRSNGDEIDNGPHVIGDWRCISGDAKERYPVDWDAACKLTHGEDAYVDERTDWPDLSVPGAGVMCLR